MRNEITYKENYIVKSTDTNRFHKLTPSSLLKILQDAATFGAEYVNAGKDKTMNLGYLWVLLKLEINVNRWPLYMEDIRIETYPNNNVKFIYPRTFNIYDKDNNLLINAKSDWCLLNAKTRELVLPKEYSITMPESIDMDRISKIEIMESSLKEKRKIRFSDTDLNGHLNNTRYLDFILDLYDGENAINSEIISINMSFHEEVKENDIIDIYASDNKEYFILKKNDKRAFECNIKYKKEV